MSETTPGSQQKRVARADDSSRGNSQQMQSGILYPNTSLSGNRPTNKASETIDENKNIRADSDGYTTMERSTLQETSSQSKLTMRSSFNRDASSYGSALDTSAGSDKLKSNGEYEISKQGRVWCIRDLKTNKLTTLKTIKANEVFFESKELISVDGVFHQLIVHNGKKPKLQIAERSSSSSEDERKPNACDFSSGSKSDDDYSETRTTSNSLPESEEPSRRFQKQPNITRTENAMAYMKAGAGTDLFKEAEETEGSGDNQSDERASKQQNNSRSKPSTGQKRNPGDGGQASPSYNPGSTGDSHDGSTEQPGKPPVTGTGQECDYVNITSTENTTEYDDNASSYRRKDVLTNAAEPFNEFYRGDDSADDRDIIK
ncbi:hypothetical protein MAR_015218, partial [Mya arenaria]